MEKFAIEWVVCAALVLLMSVVISTRITGSYVGILIDSRNKMSLSQFQVVLWTWLLISSFLAVALGMKTVNIGLSEELWALMGISVASGAGSIIVKGKKKSTEVDEAKMGMTTAVPLDGETRPVSQSVQHANKDVSEARWADMFKGEEIVDHNYVDVSKVQMFFFTIAIWLGYAYVLWGATFEINEGVVAFPELSTSVVTLIGISHAGYLTVKASPKTPSKQ